MTSALEVTTAAIVGHDDIEPDGYERERAQAAAVLDALGIPKDIPIEMYQDFLAAAERASIAAGIIPEITDAVYGGNPLFSRLYKGSDDGV